MFMVCGNHKVNPLWLEPFVPNFRYSRKMGQKWKVGMTNRKGYQVNIQVKFLQHVSVYSRAVRGIPTLLLNLWVKSTVYTCKNTKSVLRFNFKQSIMSRLSIHDLKDEILFCIMTTEIPNRNLQVNCLLRLSCDGMKFASKLPIADQGLLMLSHMLYNKKADIVH